MTRERRRVSKNLLAVVVIVIIVLAGLTVYVAIGSQGTSTSHASTSQTTPISASTSNPSGAQLNVTLTPAVLLIAPGQTQNYSAIQIEFAGTLSVGTMTLAASSPSGISFSLNQTSISPSSGPLKIPVILKAGSDVQQGKYSITLTVSSGSQTLASKNFTVDVVPALVVIKSLAFHPQNITVHAGTTLTWINLDSNIGCCDPGNHNVVFLSGATGASTTLRRLDTYSATFSQPAVVAYYCSIHPYMKGWITVTG